MSSNKGVTSIMKKILSIIIIALVIAVFYLVGCGRQLDVLQTTPRNSPNLFVNLMVDGESVQRVRAIQGVTNWHWNGGGYLTDSLHPLQLFPCDYEEATIFLDIGDNIIELVFSENYNPTSISAKRWNAEYIYIGGAQLTDRHFRNWTSAEVVEKTIHLVNNGESYIFEIEANWPSTNSFATYAFRVISANSKGCR